jgi:hypothetical protein
MAVLLTGFRIWHRELHRFAGDYSVRGVGQFEQHLVRARFQADYDHCFAAGVDKKCHGKSSTVR